MDGGQVAKRSNATDCKSVGSGLRRFESFPAHTPVRSGGEPGCGEPDGIAGVTQLVESQPSKLLVAGSSPVSRSRDVEKKSRETVVGVVERRCLAACVAQLVEHFLGKEEVTGSIPVASSTGSVNFGVHRERYHYT